MCIALEIMNIARPLWEDIAKAREELEKQISEIMQEAGKRAMSGDGAGESGDADATPEEGAKEKRRSATLAKMDSSTAKEEKGEATTAKDAATHGETSDGSTDAGDGASKLDEEQEDCVREKGDSDSDSASDADFDFQDEMESLSAEKALSKEDKAEMKEDLRKAKEEMEEKEKEDARDNTEIESESLKLGSATVSASSICNHRATVGSDYASEHARIVAEMSVGIANTTRQLRRMLSIAQEETEYATRGRINVNRLNCGKNTARVFDRKKVPNNIADLIVGVAVDLSGSMAAGARETAARKCCVALAEICNNLHIPLYVMGFTGDVESYKIYHEHFITWKNSKKDRESLAGIRARCENYDGASIRYFANIMKKKQAKHKLMIVVSDGAPCGSGYYGAAANKDTALAIRDARKTTDVLGVAIGNSNTALLHSFYGNDFLHVSTPSDLFAQLSVKLKKFVKKWIDEE